MPTTPTLLLILFYVIIVLYLLLLFYVMIVLYLRLLFYVIFVLYCRHHRHHQQYFPGARGPGRPVKTTLQDTAHFYLYFKYCTDSDTNTKTAFNDTPIIPMTLTTVISTIPMIPTAKYKYHILMVQDTVTNNTNNTNNANNTNNTNKTNSNNTDNTTIPPTAELLKTILQEYKIHHAEVPSISIL